MDELTRRTTFAWLAALALAFSWRSVADIDVGLHLAGGRYWFEHGVPRSDPFTWTVSENAYVAYHWLFQAALYAIDRLAGAAGMVALRAVLVLGTLLALVDVLRTRGVSQGAAACVGLLALLVAEWRFALRPELVSWLFAAIMLAVLERHREGRGASLHLLPMLQCLWANTHIHAFGLVIVGVYAAAEVVRQRSVHTPLVGWAIACGLATLFNPYFLEGALYPLHLATRLSDANAFGANILELVSPFALRPDPDHPFSESVSLWAYRALFAAAVVALGVQLRSRRFEDAALLVLFGGLSALAIRNLPLFAVLCAPAIAAGLDTLLGSRREGVLARGAWAAAMAGTLVLLYAVVFGNYYASERRPQRFGAALCASCLTLDTADFVAQADLQGHGLNNLAMGSVLVWRDPERKVFIDGRNEVTGEAFFAEYQRALEPARWSDTQQRYDLDYVVMAHRGDGRAAALLPVLLDDPAWRLVQLDGAGYVFVRSAGPNGALPSVALPAVVDGDARAAGLAGVRAKPAGFFAWFGETRAPLGDAYGLGNLLARAGLPAAAEGPLLEASLEHPQEFEPHLDLGLVYRELQLGPEALGAFARALALAPDHPGLSALRAARDTR